jgi:hypothetical protein
LGLLLELGLRGLRLWLRGFCAAGLALVAAGFVLRGFLRFRGHFDIYTSVFFLEKVDIVNALSWLWAF